MAYTDKKAPGRTNPAADSITSEMSTTPASGSNQERTQGQSAKFRTVTVATGKYNEGNQVRLQGNTKGTGEAGRPTSVALAGKRKVEAAVENPDGERNRPGKF